MSAVLSGVGCFVAWDYTRVDRDFRQLKSLLMDARCRAVGQGRQSEQDKILVVRFMGDSVSVAEKDNDKGMGNGKDTGKGKGKGKGVVIKTLIVPTLDQVNYDTTLGDDMIVFYKQGTGKYNKRVHGGDIQLKSYGLVSSGILLCAVLAWLWRGCILLNK